MKFFNRYFFIGFGCGALFIFLCEAALLVWGVLMASSRMESRLEPPETPAQVDANAPLADYNFAVKDLNGNVVTGENFKGKVLFLNVWATWCPPCKAEMPSLQKLYDRFKDKKEVAFILMTDDEEETVKAFMKKKKYTFPVYLYKSDNLPDVFSGRSIPRTYIITPDGKIAYEDMGAAKWDSEKTVVFISNLTTGNFKSTPQTMSIITSYSIRTNFSTAGTDSSRK